MATPDSLRQAITSLHQAIAEHQDPQAKATLATCLSNMLKVQQQDYAQHGQTQTAAQTVASSLQRSY